MAGQAAALRKTGLKAYALYLISGGFALPKFDPAKKTNAEIRIDAERASDVAIEEGRRRMRANYLKMKFCPGVVMATQDGREVETREYYDQYATELRELEPEAQFPTFEELVEAARRNRAEADARRA